MNPKQPSLITLHGRVEHILAKYPNTRNSDLELQAAMASYFYPPLEYQINNWRDIVMAMSQIPSLDHIARVRRKVIQANGYTKYLPTSLAVAKARKINEDTWRKYAHSNPRPMSHLHASNIPEGYQRQYERDEL